MSKSTKFTLRFRNPATHEVLGVVADRYGVSKNQLAEQLLERELQAEALVLELDLAATLELLQRYQPSDHLEAAIQDVAEAEAFETDPLKARRVDAAETHDPFGVMEAFAS